MSEHAEPLRKLYEPSNTNDGRVCVLVTPENVIRTVGHTMNQHNDERLTMHPIEWAILSTTVPESLIDGKCYTTHLPCYTCLRTLSFMKIKDVIYVEDNNKPLTKEYTSICKLLRIDIKHINKDEATKIISETPKK